MQPPNDPVVHGADIEHEDDVRQEPIAFNFAELVGHEEMSKGGQWTKAQLLDLNRVKLELDMSAPDKRSFMKELGQSADDKSL